MILIVCCVVLLLTVPIAWLLLPLTKPQTVEDARAEVIASVEAVFQTLPPELVLSDEQSTSDVPCPTDDEALAVQLRRVIVVADAFDLRVWPALLRERFTRSRRLARQGACTGRGRIGHHLAAGSGPVARHACGQATRMPAAS